MQQSLWNIILDIITYKSTIILGFIFAYRTPNIRFLICFCFLTVISFYFAYYEVFEEASVFRKISKDLQQFPLNSFKSKTDIKYSLNRLPLWKWRRKINILILKKKSKYYSQKTIIAILIIETSDIESVVYIMEFLCLD